MEWAPIILTFQLAAVTTVCLFGIAIPIAHWLAFTKSRFKPVVETLVSMPLVLPPTVVGFYLLVAFSPSYVFGSWLKANTGIQLLFSFEGLVVASIIYSMPFMVQPIQSGLSNLPKHLTEASIVLGKSRLATLFAVLLPNIRPALISGIVLSFAHTIGEFGVVLMIGGSIPGKTKVASIAIYEEVESLNYGIANTYSLILFAVTFTILLSVYLIQGRYQKRLPG